MKSKCLSVLIMLMVICSSAFAETYYESGSQIFSINAGVEVPLTLTNFGNGNTTVGPGEGDTHLSVGGIGSIDYQVFFNPYLAVGGELGYQFNFALDGNLFTSVPIHLKLTYVPLQGRFEIPISLGLGANYISYDSMSKICLSASFDVGFRYFFSDEWGLGLKTGISIIPELYTDSSKNSLITQIPAILSVSYRH